MFFEVFSAVVLVVRGTAGIVIFRLAMGASGQPCLSAVIASMRREAQACRQAWLIITLCEATSPKVGHYCNVSIADAVLL